MFLYFIVADRCQPDKIEEVALLPPFPLANRNQLSSVIPHKIHYQRFDTRSLLLHQAAAVNFSTHLEIGTLHNQNVCFGSLRCINFRVTVGRGSRWGKIVYFKLFTNPSRRYQARRDDLTIVRPSPSLRSRQQEDRFQNYCLMNSVI